MLKRKLSVGVQKGQAKLLSLVLKGLSHCPIDKASILCGTMFGLIGPLLPISKIAVANLKHAFPKGSPGWRKHIIKSMWRNLGQTFGEFPHLYKFQQTQTGVGYEVDGQSYLDELANNRQAAIFISGHIGNWELLPVIVARCGAEFATMYRRANNPFVDALIQQYRRRNLFPYHPPFFPKGALGGHEALQWVRRKGRLGLLVDQKLNEGIAASFFGRKAMTAPAAALMAIRYQCPIYTGLMQRLGPGRLKMVFRPLIRRPPTDPTPTAIYDLVQHMNNALEEWIRQDPACWLWIHNRWPKR